MTSLAVAKLIIDGLLFSSLVFVAFRVLGRQQPGNIANLAKLKELESSLKDIVRDADDAGRNLSEELLGRKRDLEKLLTEVEGAESRFNKSKNASEELINATSNLEKRLTILANNFSDLISKQERFNQESHNSFNKASHYNTDQQEELKRNLELSRLGRQLLESELVEQYNRMPEPPSFARQVKRQPTLREQIEIESQAFSGIPEQSRKVQADQFVADHQPKNDLDKTLRQDPRLGVLGALSRDSNIY